MLEDAQRKIEKEMASASLQKDNNNEQHIAKLQEDLLSLQEKLAEAHAKSERAKSMAQQTKAGNVYVISNIGSFGENVYKIGMTRRLEPQDRIDELGDASVPFRFDVHAIIYSDNAPELENRLHKSIAHKRLNLVNMRKEFFHVSLSDIKEEVNKIHPQAEFFMLPEAEEYHQTRVKREATLAHSETIFKKQDVFVPQEI